MFHSERDVALYHHAIYCALAALIRRASLSGRGWYHFVGNELKIATEVVL